MHINQSPRRADAQRNRERVLEIARGRLNAGELSLPMNDIAREAGLGVGTVYRHFPTRQSLLEALVSGPLDVLVERLNEASTIDDPWTAFSTFFHAIVTVQTGNMGLSEILTCPTSEMARTRDVMETLQEGADRLIKRGQAVGAIAEEFTVSDMQRLMCGIEHAVRIQPAEGPSTAHRYTDLLLAGLKRGR